jgi:hypothetical protein
MKRSLQELEKPTVIRKFRPPVSKYRLQHEESLSKKVQTVPVFEPNGSSENEPEPIIRKKRKPVEPVEFRSINSWLAGKDPTRSSKTIESLNHMLSMTSLVSTFKRMAEQCRFTTTSVRNLNKHLNCHEESSKLQKFVYDCPYCEFRGGSSNELIEHYHDHRFDKF